MNDVTRCAGPGCARPLNRPATGRPAKYCGDNCRQAAHRDQVRAAQAERERADQLAAAKAATARLCSNLSQVGSNAANGLYVKLRTPWPEVILADVERSAGGPIFQVMRPHPA